MKITRKDLLVAIITTAVLVLGIHTTEAAKAEELGGRQKQLLGRAESYTGEHICLRPSVYNGPAFALINKPQCCTRELRR